MGKRAFKIGGSDRLFCLVSAPAHWAVVTIESKAEAEFGGQVCMLEFRRGLRSTPKTLKSWVWGKIASCSWGRTCIIRAA